MEAIPNQIEQVSSKKRLKELESTGKYLFHGSPSKIETFEPKQAYTDIDGKPTPDGEPSVFASEEIETPIFRSIFHENNFAGLEGSYEIGFSNSDDGSHYIHANEKAIEVCRQNSGYVYVFNRNEFTLRGNSEWVTDKKVKPVGVFHSVFEDVGLPIYSSRTETENISNPD